MSPAAPFSRPARSLLVLLLAGLWLANLDHRVLLHPDEGRYAEIAREMAASGDWITPRLNGLKYFEKPPLQYWLTGALFRAFGPDEWSARLVPALAGMVAVLAIGWAGARLGGPRLGWAAGILLAGTRRGLQLQRFLSTGGIKFFDPDELQSLLDHAGFDPDPLRTNGPVFFAGATKRG